MSKMMDNLVEIDQKDLHHLKNLFTTNDKQSSIAYMTIDNYIRWFDQNPNLKNVKFFSLNGDFSDGTFIVTDRCFAYADTLNESNDRLYQLLQLIDYSNGYEFLSVRTEVKSIIKLALEKVNMEITKENSTLLYYLPKEEALKFDVRTPEGIELREIHELRDIEKVNLVWPFCSPHSLGMFQRYAEYNPQVGAFKEDGTLVAWVFCHATGLLCALQTDEIYYGKGYAELVARCVSKKIAEKGHDVYASILEMNAPSRSLFAKLGFKSIDEVHWMETEITWSPADE